jgi:hypothetical protein
MWVRCIQTARTIVVLGTSFLLLTASLSAEEPAITVLLDGDGDYASIQEAINAAPVGAMIRVGPGEWKECVTISKSVILEGAGWDQTRLVGSPTPEASPELVQALRQIIDELESNDVQRQVMTAFAKVHDGQPTISVKSTDNVQISNLSCLRHGDVRKGTYRCQAAILVDNADVSIHACAIIKSPGIGVDLRAKSSMKMEDCLVANSWGQGIRVATAGDGPVEILNCDIRNCVYSGVSIAASSGPTSVKHCQIHGNGWHGIRYDSAAPTIEDNLFYDTAVSGIYASGKTAAAITNNLFYGSGISCWFQNQDKIERNTFLGPRSIGAPGGLSVGIQILGSSRPTLKGNLFVGCENAITFSDIRSESPFAKTKEDATILGNAFWNNERDLGRRGGEEIESVPLPAGNWREPPTFVAASEKNFALAPEPTLASRNVGAAGFPEFASPWPQQAGEERARQAVLERLEGTRGMQKSK